MPALPPDSENLLQRNLERDAAVIYVLDPDLRIVYCNEAWDRFAAENGGHGLERHLQLGQCVMDAVPDPLRQFYDDIFRKVLASRQAWEHSYECSSATVFRNFRMAVHPAPRAEGLVVVNSLTVERPHDSQDRKIYAPDPTVYLRADGIVAMCCHCRRTSRVRRPAVWDWVPAYVEKPPEKVSHSICDVCLSLHYPDFETE
jgi:hypothetical protein